MLGQHRADPLDRGGQPVARALKQNLVAYVVGNAITAKRSAVT